MAELESANGVGPKRGSLFLRAILLAMGLNVLAWVAAAWLPDAQEIWKYISLVIFFVVGLAIGRWWALLVTGAFGVIHAVPVYFGLLPGYLSTWGEALWWVFALALLSAVTALGVLVRGAIRWLRTQFASRARNGETRQRR
jgi:hypothetical protein